LLLMFIFSLGPINATAMNGQGQEGDFCNTLKVTGTGTFEVGVSVKDRQLASEYDNFMTGDGDLEMDTGTVEAQKSAKIPGMVNGSAVPLDLFENTRLTYSGKTPMVGIKHISSNSFWGGIGADITETFSVTEMDRAGSSYFASANPASYTGDPNKIAELLKASPVQTVGIDTRNAFNGTWQTDAHMHKMFSKDLKVHEAFTGKFDVEKRLVFHENPGGEKVQPGCGIDC